MFGHTNEPVTLSRDVRAIIVPAGEELLLREGTAGFITQALGGSFTVYFEGNLFLIAGTDADALGKEPVPAPEVPENATDQDIEAVIWQQLTVHCQCRRIDRFDGAHRVTLDAGDLHASADRVAGTAELVFDPPWHQGMMSDEARLQTGLM
jgi:hypothetical protein